MPINGRQFAGLRLALLPSVVAAAEIFFEPDIGADEKIPAAHFFDLELGDAEFPVAPRDGCDRVAVPAHDGFQRKLDGEIEMRGEERAAAVDDGPTVSLERVRRVVERNIETETNER